MVDRPDRGKPWNPVWRTGILDTSGTYYARFTPKSVAATLAVTRHRSGHIALQYKDYL